MATIQLTYQLIRVNLVDMSTFEVLEAFISMRRQVALLRASETKTMDCGHNQISVLYKLSLAPATMGELADHTSSDKASITRTVAVLEKNQLVKRVQDEADRRITYIHLTPKGKVQARKAHEIRNSIGKKLDQTLSPSERKQFTSLVRKIVENL